MGQRNKYLFNEAQVFGKKFIDLSSHDEKDDSYFSRKIAKLIRNKFKARKLKKLIKKRLNSFSDLKLDETKYKPGKLFQPCSYGFWNSVIAEVKTVYIGGVLYLDEIIGTDGRAHGFGGCGDCSPLNKEKVEKQREHYISFYRELAKTNSMYSALVKHYESLEIEEDGTCPKGRPCP